MTADLISDQWMRSWPSIRFLTPQSLPRDRAIQPSIMMTSTSPEPARLAAGLVMGACNALFPRAITQERIASSLMVQPHSAASAEAFSYEPVSTAVRHTRRCKIGVSRWYGANRQAFRMGTVHFRSLGQ